MTEEGRIDFERRRALTSEYGGTLFWSETLIDGPVLYVRFGPDEEYVVHPGDDDAAAPIKLGISPLFLLDALGGVEAVHLIGEDEVRGVPTTHLRLSIDSERAQVQSPAGLRFPSDAHVKLPAELWLDQQGRIRRMACTWPLKSRPLLRTIDQALFGFKQYWLTTEFWDFGGPPSIEVPDRER